MILGAKFLRVSDVSDGDLITIQDEGKWIESTKFTYSDGKPKQQLQFQIEISTGESRIFTLNKINRENLMATWGSDTSKWVGKEAMIMIKEAEVAGTMKKVIRLRVADEI